MRRVISNIMAFMWFFGILAHSLFWEALAILLYRRFCAGCHRLGAGFSELLL